MTRYPDTPALLLAAREALLERLVPRLPEDCRLDALVIANILAIVAREAQAGEGPRRAALARLRALYGEDAPAEEGGGEPGAAERRADGHGASDDPLLALTRRLARDLRARAFDDDPARFEAMRSHLVETTIDALRVNNPRYLEVEGLA